MGADADRLPEQQWHRAEPARAASGQRNSPRIRRELKCARRCVLCRPRRRRSRSGLATREDLELTPEHYAGNGIPRFIAVNEDLLTLLGFYRRRGFLFRIATAFASRSAMATSASPPRCGKRMRSVFGIAPNLYKSAERCAELKLVNRVAALAWQHAVRVPKARLDSRSGFRISCSTSAKNCALAFLRGYLLGDGTVCKDRIAFSDVVIRPRQRH